MCVRHPEFVLLLWFPAVLLAQGAGRCSLHLNDGFILPNRDYYNDNETVSYSCDKGKKPAAEGWWATITCKNGAWSPAPACIDESDCLPPGDVPNTKYHPSDKAWFRNGTKIQIHCDSGYEVKNRQLTATCTDGAWPSLPVCERRADSCSKPPQLPHTVIINQKYQEVFAADSVVMYRCERGYSTEQGDTKTKTVICSGSVDGNWTDGPTCKPSGPMIGSVSVCGSFPNVPNSDVEQSSMSLKYSCRAPYKLTGTETVVCYNDGTWSDAPTCEAQGGCVLDPAQLPYEYYIHGYGGEIVPEGQTIYRDCHDNPQYRRAVKCINGQLAVARQCCFHTEAVKGSCW